VTYIFALACIFLSSASGIDASGLRKLGNLEPEGLMVSSAGKLGHKSLEGVIQKIGFL
jgi:hypothetical protein